VAGGGVKVCVAAGPDEQAPIKKMLEKHSQTKGFKRI
jgi:hypothetical protein